MNASRARISPIKFCLFLPSRGDISKFRSLIVKRSSMEETRIGHMGFNLFLLLLLLLMLQSICISSAVMDSSATLLNDSVVTDSSATLLKDSVVMDSSATLLSNSSEKLGFRVHLNRRDNHLSFQDRFRSAVDRSHRRIGNMTIGIRTPVHVGDGEFLMTIAVGTPAVKLKAIVDTGSDLIWTQCNPCKPCIKQRTPLFDSKKSATYKRIPCNNRICQAMEPFRLRCRRSCRYAYSYADGTYSSGFLGYETFTIGRSAKVHDIAFGCGHRNQGKYHGNGGLVGLGRGPLSLLSQLGSKISYKFSYCFLPIDSLHSETSPLFFGHAAEFRGGKTLSLVQNRMNPSLWYIPMTGISVAGETVPISLRALRVKRNGSGGLIIDSGTTLSYFVRSIYRPLRRAIKRAVELRPLRDPPLPLDLCYSRPANWPSLTFHFQGDIDMHLPVGNYFFEAGPDLWCLAFAQSNSFSVLGNLAQQNFQFLFDHARNEISFKPEDCGSL